MSSSLFRGISNPLRIRSLLIGFASVAYLVQVATPLRLVGDGIDYLLQASSAIDGRGFLYHGVKSMRPPGYPALIFILAKAGIANSVSIVALNCLFIGIGCWASYLVARKLFAFSRSEAQSIVLLTLFSFVFVRNAVYPLSDICFFGTSMLCLLISGRDERAPLPDRLKGLALSVPLLLLSFELRTIGIALIPALLWSLVGGMEGMRQLTNRLWPYRFVVLIVLACITALVGRSLIESRYFRFNAEIFQHRGVLGTIALDSKEHSQEWGEVVVNAPASKMPHALQLPLRIIGMIAILVWATGLWLERDKLNAAAVYAAGYACIVFVYPWYDTRLWLPVIPLLMAQILLTLKKFFRLTTLVKLEQAYGLYFCVLGIIALAFSTRITFSGDRFPDLYGDGRLRTTYQYAFRGEAQAEEGIDPDALYLIKRFDLHIAHLEQH